jgi:hypothetical protein
LIYHPIALVLFSLAIASVYWFSIRPARKKKQMAEAENAGSASANEGV